MPEPKFGDIAQQPSDDYGHVATYMFIGYGKDNLWQGLCIDDDDPEDKSLIGQLWPIMSRETSWVDGR